MFPRIFALGAVLLLAAGGAALADGDPANGEKVFRKCKACHTATADGPNKVGPNLYGIVDAAAARQEGYKYSDAFLERAAEGLVWTEENLDHWLENPLDFAPRSKMVLKLAKESEREDIIAYLRSQAPPATVPPDNR